MINFLRVFVLGLMSVSMISSAMNVPIEDFSILAYSQVVNDYLPPDALDYHEPVISEAYQKQQMLRFYHHYFSSDAQGLSPWSETFVKAVLPLVRLREYITLVSFRNSVLPENQRHYGENYKLHDETWWINNQKNMDFPALDTMDYKADHRAIAVNNTMARELPDMAPDFFSATIAGQGFPFDNLQDSAIWAGTPLYVLSVSKDKEWALVLTPDLYFAWVQSRDIAYASEAFIQQWQSAIKTKPFAVIKTGISILDKHQQFRLKGYIGAVFPGAQQQNGKTSILIPEKNIDNQAMAGEGYVNADEVSLMPLKPSKKNIANLLQQLQNRPYGWGGMFFFNDCSQEMKSLFTPLGIWLPRNTARQARLSKNLDLSKLPIDERIAALKSKGHPLMTLIYIGGHVMLYVGNQIVNGQDVPMTYQNIWGLRNIAQDKRLVIGQSLFLPLLKSFPDQPDVLSQAGREQYFELIYLDQLDNSLETIPGLVKHFVQ